MKKIFAKNLNALMQLHPITTDELAGFLCISSEHLHNIRKGTDDATIPVIYCASDFFRVSVDCLLDEHTVKKIEILNNISTDDSDSSQDKGTVYLTIDIDETLTDVCLSQNRPPFKLQSDIQLLSVTALNSIGEEKFLASSDICLPEIFEKNNSALFNIYNKLNTNPSIKFDEDSFYKMISYYGKSLENIRQELGDFNSKSHLIMGEFFRDAKFIYYYDNGLNTEKVSRLLDLNSPVFSIKEMCDKYTCPKSGINGRNLIDLIRWIDYRGDVRDSLDLVKIARKSYRALVTILGICQ